MYERTLKEMDLTDCSTGHIQSTAYNVQMAAYMIQGICYLDNIGEEQTLFYLLYRNECIKLAIT
jgi:hypothetical protein